MRTLIVFLSVLTVMAGAMIGCGGKKGGSPAVAVTPAAVSGVSSCLAGQVYHSSYGCLDRAHCQESYGWVPTLQRCEAGTPVTWDNAYGGTATLRWGASLQGIHRDTFEQVMREYGGFCDQYTWNWGNARCSAYSSKGYIILQATNANSTELQITIGAGASEPYYQSDYWSAFVGTNASFPMQFRGQVYTVNNGAGLEIRAQTPSRPWSQMNGQGLTIYIENGRVTDSVLNAEIHYISQPLATAGATRY